MNDTKPPALVGRTAIVGTRVAQITAFEPTHHAPWALRYADGGNEDGHCHRNQFFLVPTREEIAEALHDHDNMHTWRGGHCDDACGIAAFKRADIVIAVLSTTSTQGDSQP